VKVSEYISSGLIESYVLGLATEEERMEVEKMCQLYPEVQASRTDFEYALEALALEEAAMPPAALKQTIMAGIDQADNNEGARLVNLQNDEQGKVRRLRFGPIAAAASTLLLIASVAANLILYNQYKQSKSQLTALQQTQQQQLADLNQQLADVKKDAAMINDPKMAKIVMKGLPETPEALATVYWHTGSKDVYLMVNNLPKPAADQQYQLWAIIDGKPVDAGLLNMEEQSAVHKMKNIPQAQAFAVTLEKRGGSPTPNLKAMYVMANV
jgi:anti-sigma-K factor RskA